MMKDDDRIAFDRLSSAVRKGQSRDTQAPIGFITTWVASARRSLNRPPFEAGACHVYRGKSTSDNSHLLCGLPFYNLEVERLRLFGRLKVTCHHPKDLLCVELCSFRLFFLPLFQLL